MKRRGPICSKRSCSIGPRLDPVRLALRAFPVVIGMAAAVAAARALSETDLDAFMRLVLAERDQNWKKLQQYVLDERELIDVRGPGRTPIWGERREYTWYIRDGFFVRSPVRFNGVAIAEPERRKFEADYLERQQARERRRAAPDRDGASNARPAGQQSESESADVERPLTAGSELDGLLKQTGQPGFISSAYFLRFKFEEGKYALAGRETLDGRNVLRIEYYPTKLFGGTDRRRNRDGTSDRDRAYDTQFQRLMNKVALVTLWIEPNAHQIVKYTFTNLPMEFLPGQWLVHVDQLAATMTMLQPFPEVWLPGEVTIRAAMTFAIGQVDVNYAIQYHDYRRADVTTKITIR
jgi:hypothetical protein